MFCFHRHANRSKLQLKWLLSPGNIQQPYCYSEPADRQQNVIKHDNKHCADMSTHTLKLSAFLSVQSRQHFNNWKKDKEELQVSLLNLIMPHIHTATWNYSLELVGSTVKPLSALVAERLCRTLVLFNLVHFDVSKLANCHFHKSEAFY